MMIWTTGKHRGVYFSGKGSKTDSNRLIACDSNENKCEIIEDSIINLQTEPAKLYYLNGDSTGARIITQVKVEVDDTPSRKRGNDDYWHWGFPEAALAKSNAIFINGNGYGDTNALIHCSSETECTEVTPSASDKYLDVIDGSIISKSGSWSEAAITGGKEKYYLYNKSDGKLLGSGETGALVICKYNDEAWGCDVKNDDTNHFYMDSFNSNQMIVNTNNVFSIPSEYSLGYYINNDNEIIKCITISSCEKYNVVEDTCSKTNAGTISSEGKFCIGSDGDDVIEASISETKKLIVEISNSNFPGITSGTIIVSMSDNKIVRVSEDAYYLVNKSTREFIGSGTESGIVYTCTKQNSACDLSLKNKLSATDEKYYPNSSNGSTIKCILDTDTNENKCTIRQAVAGEVYCSISSKLNACKGNCSTECKIIQNRIGYYLPYGNNGLINCTGNNNCPILSDPKEGYYISEDSSKPLIRCSKSTVGMHCEYDSTVNDGYYIGGDSTVKFIKCKSSVCQQEEKVTSNNTRNKWYISGEADIKMIKLENNNNPNIINFSSIVKPTEGWYVNGDGKGLIQCVTSSNSINCSETNIPNEGYYINADVIFNNNVRAQLQQIIVCSLNECKTENITPGYYVNGRNKQLIYCNNGHYCYEETGNGWYKSKSSNVINCVNSICTSYSPEKLKSGYYINSDTRSKFNNPLLKITSYNVQTQPISKNGWYLNSDENSDKKIIECMKGTIYHECDLKQTVTSCSSSNNGKFIIDSGEIKWCNGNNSVKLQEKKNVFNTFTSRFGWITETSGTAVFNINNDKVTQSKIDGYWYDIDNKILYNCSKYGSMLCTK
eukprot:jgi/Orpsp1_1/1183668/evm.model.c7180000086227.2